MMDYDCCSSPLLGGVRGGYSSRPTTLNGQTTCECSVVPILTRPDRKSTRLNSSHLVISYAVFCLKHIAPNDALFTAKPPGNRSRSKIASPHWNFIMNFRLPVCVRDQFFAIPCIIVCFRARPVCLA